jgi:hypothetical protein
MAKRFDLSDKLIHFTRGESQEDAFSKLRAIIGERSLIAGKVAIHVSVLRRLRLEHSLMLLSGGSIHAVLPIWIDVLQNLGL